MKRILFFLIVVFSFSSFLSYSQVSYGSVALYGLRKLNTTYTSSAIQVRRACDNATANIGFTSCGDLDTATLKNFVLVPNPLSAMSYVTDATYSLRKMLCTYSGNAINVRRSCDNATKDIGFTSLGDLDTIALKAFVMASNPLSALSVNASVAYGLRRLRCAYNGAAIKVRKAVLGNPTQDIGFTANGDLDTVALKAFIGAAQSGYIDTWYDQSGNGINISPPAIANQPRIVNAGVIDRKNGVPTIFFDGVNDYFTTNAFSTVGYTGFTSNILASWTTVGNAIANIQALIDNDHNCTKGFIVQDRPDLVNKPVTSGMPNASSCNTVNDAITTGNGTLRILTYVNNTTSETAFRNGSSLGTQAYAGAYVIGSRFMIGAWYNGGGISRYLSGLVSEVIIFKSALSTTDRQYLEWGQSQYFNVAGPSLSTLPSGAPSAFIATWYDQSANGYNLTQATAGFQPRIVNAGVIDRPSASSRVGVYFDGVDDFMTNAGYNRYLNSQTPTWNAVIFPKATINAYAPIVSWRSAGSVCSQLEIAGSNNWNNCWWSNNVNWTTTNGLTRTYDAYQILTHYIQATASQLYYNGTLSYNNTGQSNAPAVNTVLHTGTPLNVGVDNCCGGRFIKGYLKEIVLGSTNMSATDRQYLEYSQSQYYGISGPVLASTLPAGVPGASVTTWYDQSGNGTNLSPTGVTTRQPQIVNAGFIVRQALAGTWPAIQGTNGSQTNLTAVLGSAYAGNVLSINSVLRSDINTNSNLRVVSVGNAALTSADWSNISYFNINQRNTNQFVFERSGVAPSTAFTVGSPMILSGRFTGANRQLFNNGTGSATQADANSFNFNAIRILQSINPAFEAGEAFTGKMSEFGMYYSSLSNTRRTLIESNQAAYYNITISNSKYTPPTPTTYNRFVVGIGREAGASGDSVAVTRESAGMGFSVTATAAGFLKDDGDYIAAGINCPITNSTNTTFLGSAAPVVLRWDNDWYIDKRDVGTTGGVLSIYFDFGDYNIGTTPGVAANYSLLARGNTASSFTVVPSAVASVAGDRVIFTMDANGIPSNSS